jgi:L-methionine (R)-S-oxide reductase
MTKALESVLNDIRAIVSSGEERVVRASRLAEAIRNLGPYRWVGVYDVGPDLVSIIAWSGPAAPACPTFPVTQGLTGAAITQKTTVVVGDVTKDRRYLTCLGSTVSEIIIPILKPGEGSVVGTIDVESEQANAFSEGDRQRLEKCGQAAMTLWQSSA